MPLGYRGQPSQVVQGQSCMKGLLCDDPEAEKEMEEKGGQAEGEEEGGQDFQAGLGGWVLQQQSSSHWLSLP